MIGPVSQCLTIVSTASKYEGPLACLYRRTQSLKPCEISHRQITTLVLVLTFDMYENTLASERVVELQEHYAPERIFSRAALGGLVPNITSSIYTVNGRSDAHSIPPELLGAINKFPDATDFLSKLRPAG